MRTKLLFFLFCLCCFISTSTVTANSNAVAITKRIALSGNDINFDIPRGSTGGSRSLTPEIPISAFIVDNNLIELDFVEAIGEIEITISQDGASIYSSSENILAPLSKGIQLSPDLSGNFLLEIRGANGACAYAWFAL